MDAPRPLEGIRIALLVEEGFEDAELTEPLQALSAAGARVVLVGPVKGRTYAGKRGLASATSEEAATAVRMADFDALIVPGGHAPDRMRLRHAMVDLVHDAVAQQKPVAAICHGPQLLISANVLKGRTVTCWPSIAVDVKNAGALYVDRPVVVDGGVITSRKPQDLPQFIEAITRALSARDTAG